MTGERLSIDTRGQALNNTRGTLTATGGVDLQSGALTNTAGLIRSGSAMAIDTHGQALVNTDAAGYRDKEGGIASGGALTLEAGAVDNTGGFIGAKKALRASTQAFTNASGGVVFGEDTLTIDTQGAAYDNTGGKTEAMGGLRIDAQTIDNTTGLIRSLATTTLSAGAIVNADTLDEAQGIEGRNVAIAARTLDNGAGAIRADSDLSIRSSASVINTGGLISARGTLAIEDPNAADPATKALDITNTGGTLVGDGGLKLDAARFSGDGKMASHKDIAIALTQDVVHTGELSANGDVSYTTLGRFTNSARLLVGGALTVGGGEVENSEGAEMRGTTTTQVRAERRLVNRGLIDGNDTRIDAGALVNAVTGKLYGDRVSIAARSVLNEGERTRGGAIAARERLDIGAVTVTNQAGALIFSGNTLAIGGALDAQRAATGQATALNNASAVIESLGDMRLAAATINNTNEHLAKERRLQSSTYKQTVVLQGQTEERPASDFVITERDRYLALKAHPDKYNQRQSAAPVEDEPRDSPRYAQFGVTPPDAASEPTRADFGCTFFGACPAHDQAHATWSASHGTALAQLASAVDAYNAQVAEDNRLIPRVSRAWTEYNYTETLARDVVTDSAPARIVAGGQLDIHGVLRNVDSQVLAGGTLATDQAPTNQQSEGLEVQGRNGLAISKSWVHQGGLNSGTRYTHLTTPYAPPDSVASFKLPGWRYEPGNAAATGTKPGPTGSVPVPERSGGTGPLTFTEVPIASATDPHVVRTSTPNAVLPGASLFHTRTDPASRYLVETDPRFADYRRWLSSDYLLNNLGLDPNHTLKRLGDGFHEQRLLREQVAQLTGRRYLDGFDTDEAQYTALMNAGATFASAYGLRPGVALTAAQMAQLTSDIVWLVEQTVTLADGSTHRVLAPQLYVRVRAGDIDASGALLSGDAVVIKAEPGAGNVVNSGTIAGRRMVSITADNVDNLGGRIAAGSLSVHARRDLDNLGGTIEARDAAVLTAGGDINVQSTTRTQTNAQGHRTNTDRVAGVYVSNSGGVLIASAGNDVNLTGAVLSSAGSAAVGAGRDINLGTVTASSSQDTTWDARNYRRTADSQDVGSVVLADGAVRLAAGNDLNVKAGTVASGSGALVASATHDINLTAGRSTRSVGSASFNERKSLTSRSSNARQDDETTTDVVSSSLRGNTVALVAGNDISTQAAQLRSDGAMSLTARRDIHLAAADQTTELRHYSDVKRSATGLGMALGASLRNPQLAGGLIEGRSGTSVEAGTATNAVGTTVSAGSLTAVSGRDITLQGATVVADRDINILAGRDLTIESAQNTRTRSSFNASGRSGSIGTDTNPSIGHVKSAEAVEASGVSQTGSQVASLQGNATLVAGGTYRQTASSVLAAGQAGPLVGGDVNILARNVVINEAYNTERSATVGRTSSTVLGGTASVGGISTDSIKGAASTVEAMGNTGDSRMQALGAVNLAMSGRQAYDTAAALANSTTPGYKVSVNLSRNTGQSTSTLQASEAVGSSVVGANNVNIVATGGGQDSNIRAVGSTIAAGNTVNLAADNAITLEASKNTFEQHGTNSSRGASIGVGYAVGAQNGFTIELGVSQGRGKDDASDVSHNNTRVSGAKAVNIKGGQVG